MASVREMREGGTSGYGGHNGGWCACAGGRRAVARGITGAAHEHSAQSQSALECCVGPAACSYTVQCKLKWRLGTSHGAIMQFRNEFLCRCKLPNFRSCGTKRDAARHASLSLAIASLALLYSLFELRPYTTFTKDLHKTWVAPVRSQLVSESPLSLHILPVLFIQINFFDGLGPRNLWTLRSSNFRIFYV